jgi:MFS family permease
MQPIPKLTVLVVVSLTSFIAPFMLSAVTIALPRIQSDYAASAVRLSWVATAYLFALSICLLPAGRLADLRGRIRIFVAGLVIFAVASLLCATAWSLASLLAFRVLQGLGAACFFTTAMALLTASFEPGERGRAFGINVASVYLGLAAGPWLGGLLTQHLGWRSIFVGTAGLAFGMSLVLARGSGRTRSRRPAKAWTCPGPSFTPRPSPACCWA